MFWLLIVMDFTLLYSLICYYYLVYEDAAVPEQNEDIFSLEIHYPLILWSLVRAIQDSAY